MARLQSHAGVEHSRNTIYRKLLSYLDLMEFLKLNQVHLFILARLALIIVMQSSLLCFLFCNLNILTMYILK